MFEDKIEASERLSSDDLREIRRAYEGTRTRGANGIRIAGLAIFAVLAVLVGSEVLLDVFQPVSAEIAPQLIATS